MASVLQVEGRGVVCLYTMLSISLSVDECRTAALPGVCLCALHMCKIPSGYVSVVV